MSKTDNILKRPRGNIGNNLCFCSFQTGLLSDFNKKILIFANTNFAMQCHTNTLKIRSTNGNRI